MKAKQLKNISFEFFPPQTNEGTQKLYLSIEQLKQYDPSYVSVTYGAGGSTQDRTLHTVIDLQNNLKLATAAHISCIFSTRESMLSLLNTYQQSNITRLVVLRGDLPSGVATRHGQFRYAADLVQFIRAQTQDLFHIEVAAYPEFHPETKCTQQGLQHFKQKIDAGANGAITQYFYNPDAYEAFLDSCAKLNIQVPIVPGIMPISNYEKLMRFSTLCGAEIPRWLRMRLQSYAEDAESIAKFGTEVVSVLSQKLLALGAPGLHFYTLNMAKPTLGILRNLGFND